MITLPKLPFESNAFGSFISEQTFTFHHGKHHKAYVDNLNKLIKGTEFEESKLEDIVKHAHGPIFNNAAQAWNHAFFWKSLDPASSEDDISEPLMKIITDSYESLDKFKNEFKNKATKVFGSGWTWAVADKNHVFIKNTSNAHTPITDGEHPLFVCDIWEHAYYLDHQNDRAAYVDQFLKHVNWKFASDNVRKK